MNRTCALLAAVALLYGTNMVRAKDNLVMGFVQQREVTSQPAPTVLPPPKAVPAEQQQTTLPAPRQAMPAQGAPAPMSESCGTCQGGCACWWQGCQERCQRLVDWLSYRPLCQQCGPCGCLPCLAPCCTPPLYLYFLSDCNEGGGCTCHAVGHSMLASAPSKACVAQTQPAPKAKPETPRQVS